MSGFTHDRRGQRVHLGTGVLESALLAELDERHRPRVALIGTERATAPMDDLLDPVARISDVRRHVPLDAAERARRLAAATDTQIIVSVGGGSATGLAKAVALELAIPIIAVPTTFAGSEATPVWGITDEARKKTGVDPRVLPAVIVYDTDLFVGLSREITVSSAINALAHGIDAMWAPRADPFSSADAEAGIHALTSALSRHAGALDAENTQSLLVGTFLASTAFAAAGSGMHHKICHVLGGRFDLPHAALHTVVLPHVLAFNVAADGDARQAIARAMRTDDPASGLSSLYQRLDAPRSLANLGLRERDLDEAAHLCLEAIPPSNPRPVDLEAIRALLYDAWFGVTPAVRSQS